MKKVSYKEILRDLYEDTDLQKMKIDEIYLSRLIRKADKKIAGLYTVNSDMMIYTVTGGVVPFPSDVFNIDYLLLGDYSDKDVYFLNSTNEFVIDVSIDDAVDNNDDIYTLWSDISFPIQYNKIEFIIANGEINVDPKYNDKVVSVIYTRYPKNNKGEIMLNENHLDPIIAWIKHHVFNREMFKKKMAGVRLFNDDFVFMRNLSSDKNRLIRNARVEDRRLNEEYTSRNIIVNSYNAMIENDIY